MSQDYIISSHVIEHLPDPISAFIEWARLLKPGDTVFMIVPHRDAHPPDKNRPVSTVDELMAAYTECYTPDTHPYQGQGRRGHYWVFTLESMKALVEMCSIGYGLDWTLVHEEAIDAKVGNGFTLVYRHEPQEMPLKYYGSSLVDDLQVAVGPEVIDEVIAANGDDIKALADNGSFTLAGVEYPLVGATIDPTGVPHTDGSFTEVTIDLSAMPADEPNGVVTDPESFVPQVHTPKKPRRARPKKQ